MYSRHLLEKHLWGRLVESEMANMNIRSPRTTKKILRASMHQHNEKVRTVKENNNSGNNPKSCLAGTHFLLLDRA